MSRSIFLKQFTRLSALAVVLVLANCGKAQQPVPQIAPPPTGNNNVYGGGGGGCGGASGVPIAQITSSGFMYGGSVSGQTAQGTLGLNVYSAEQIYSQNITGSASFNLQTQNGPVQFCASSYQVSPYQGQGMITPGQLFPMGNQMYSAVMRLWQQTSITQTSYGQSYQMPVMITVEFPQLQLGNSRASGPVYVQIQPLQGGYPQYHQLYSR